MKKIQKTKKNLNANCLEPISSKNIFCSFCNLEKKKRNINEKESEMKKSGFVLVILVVVWLWL